MSERYVSTGIAAKSVGVGLTTLLRWAHAGQVKPAFKTPGGHFRWDVDDLRAQLRIRPPEGTGDASAPEPQS